MGGKTDREEETDRHRRETEVKTERGMGQCVRMQAHGRHPCFSP